MYNKMNRNPYMDEGRMTKLTKKAYRTAIDEMTSVEDAVRFLEEELPCRSVWNRIMKYSAGRNDQEMEEFLITCFMENHPEMNSDSERRRLDQWKDPEETSSLLKKDAIEVAFILDLKYEDADDFVAILSGERLHSRSPEEIVFIYALQNGIDYMGAVNLCEKMEKLLEKAENKGREELHFSDFTQHMAEKVAQIHTTEELLLLLKEEREKFADFHNQAFVMFEGMMRILEDPARFAGVDYDVESGEKKRVLTVRDIIRDYLYEDSVLNAKSISNKTRKLAKAKKIDKSGQFILSEIQKRVCSHWPDQSMISNMRSRKADVTRKVLILLFLATDDGDGNRFEDGNTDFMEDYFNIIKQKKGPKNLRMKSAKKQDKDLQEPSWEEMPAPDGIYRDGDTQFSPDESRPDGLTGESGRKGKGTVDFIAFEELRNRMDLMLAYCGFAPLDPRNPFDWIIIYSICVEDFLDIDDYMKSIFMKMFEDAGKYRQYLTARKE